MIKPSLVRRRILFAYWGRRGALSRFTLNLARACEHIAELDATISVSRQNELFQEFLPLGPKLLAVQTFTSSMGALIRPHHLVRLRHELLQRLISDRIEAVVTLMPHIWSPLISPAIRRNGMRYLTVIHDADPHIGDRTAVATRWLLRDARAADRVITLSSAVAERLVVTGRVSQSRIATLFHPDLGYRAGPPRPRTAPAGRPLRCLFFGRIMPYKGLPILLDAWEILRREGLSIEVGVYGEGDLADCADRLRRLGAEVVNEWIAEERIAAIFDRFDVVVLPYIEASQSGIAAIAVASGLPIVATPVGGLLEQVRELETGVVAQAVDAPSLAQAIKRLLDPSVYETIQQGIAASREARTMHRFVELLVALAVA